MPRKSVKLVSAEGFEFTVDYKAACISNTIKQMLSSEGMQLVYNLTWSITLDVRPVQNTSHKSILFARRAGNFTETELGEINFPEISAPILEKICEYFYYKLRYLNE
jgi:transcription elongation factor B subunit 1